MAKLIRSSSQQVGWGAAILGVPAVMIVTSMKKDQTSHTQKATVSQVLVRNLALATPYALLNPAHNNLVQH